MGLKETAPWKGKRLHPAPSDAIPLAMLAFSLLSLIIALGLG
jgi:hypothetical protein